MAEIRKPIDLYIKNISELLTCAPNENDPIGRIPNGAIAVLGEEIVEVGTSQDIESRWDISLAKVIDVQNKVVAPGFVDSHTHVVFGGSRVKEYAARMTHSRTEVEAMGIPTGIIASMSMTRSENEETLFESASQRILGMLRAGTTTVESKSGYGLNLEHEMKMLRTNRVLHESTPVDIISTFLGAHAFPPETSQETYVEEIIHEMLPEVWRNGLASFCDVYIDQGFYSLDQTRRILEAAREVGFKLKMHVDQYSSLGGVDLAAELKVVSADHLNYTQAPSMIKLAQAGVVGVLMPMIDFAVQHPQPFQARAMMDGGMTLALATDICPGGWTESMQLVMQFACRANGFSPEEALLAATIGGAKALDLQDRGVLQEGMIADIQVWNIPSFEDAIYRLGNNAVAMVIKRGKVVVG